VSWWLEVFDGGIYRGDLLGVVDSWSSMRLHLVWQDAGEWELTFAGDTRRISELLAAGRQVRFRRGTEKVAGGVVLQQSAGAGGTVVIRGATQEYLARALPVPEQYTVAVPNRTDLRILRELAEGPHFVAVYGSDWQQGQIISGTYHSTGEIIGTSVEVYTPIFDIGPGRLRCLYIIARLPAATVPRDAFYRTGSSPDSLGSWQQLGSYNLVNTQMVPPTSFEPELILFPYQPPDDGWSFQRYVQFRVRLTSEYTNGVVLKCVWAQYWTQDVLTLGDIDSSLNTAPHTPQEQIKRYSTALDFLRQRVFAERGLEWRIDPDNTLHVYQPPEVPVSPPVLLIDEEAAGRVVLGAVENHPNALALRSLMHSLPEGGWYLWGFPVLLAAASTRRIGAIWDTREVDYESLKRAQSSGQLVAHKEQWRAATDAAPRDRLTLGVRVTPGSALSPGQWVRLRWPAHDWSVDARVSAVEYLVEPDGEQITVLCSFASGGRIPPVSAEPVPATPVGLGSLFAGGV